MESSIGAYCIEKETADFTFDDYMSLIYFPPLISFAAGA